jgi:hypothetical protein
VRFVDPELEQAVLHRRRLQRKAQIAMATASLVCLVTTFVGLGIGAAFEREQPKREYAATFEGTAEAYLDHRRRRSPIGSFTCGGALLGLALAGIVHGRLSPKEDPDGDLRD